MLAALSLSAWMASTFVPGWSKYRKLLMLMSSKVVASVAEPGGRVPASLTEPYGAHVVCMRGTASEPARCAALGGRVGEAVKCHIYEWRPGPCHELLAGSDGCNLARRRWGLPAIG